MKVIDNPFTNNDANWFTVFMKAFVEQFDGQAPTKEQWLFIVEILEGIPTKKLSSIHEPV
jgi:hypothetical protein